MIKRKPFRADVEQVAGVDGCYRGHSLTEGVRRYNQCALALDEAVARLLRTLEETGQLESTLIIFTSDQEYAWGQHGFRAKLGPYDDTIRSPLIFCMPGTLPKERRCLVPVSGVDFAPTFFGFAGFDLPWKMHGRDLTPLLKDPAREWHEPMLVTHMARSFGKDTDDPAKGDVLDGVPWWVALLPEHRQQLQRLRAQTIAELRRTGAGFVDRMPVPKSMAP